MRYSVVDKEIIRRLSWFNRLRWLAILGVLILPGFAKFCVSPNLNLVMIYIVAGFMIVYNYIFTYILQKSKIDFKRHLTHFANLQISLDLLTLTFLIHLTGGITNPFLFYFIFHMIISGILLCEKSRYFQFAFAIILFSLMVIFEKYGILKHYHVIPYISEGLYKDTWYVLATLFVFISTLFITLYITGSISEKLKARMQEIYHLNGELEEKDTLKSKYVRHVSHDIRSHLGSIKSCLGLIDDGYLGEVEKKQKDMIDRALKRVDFLLHFSNTLLSLSNMRLRGEIPLIRIDMKALCEKIYDSMKVQANEKKLKCVLELDDNVSQVLGSRIELEDAIVNLIGNSIKYTEKGSITLRAKNKNGEVILTVQDTGIGIPEEEVDTIFDEFYRANNARSSEIEGTGMGMSIVKEVVEKHHGRIWVESKIDVGTSIHIALKAFNEDDNA